MEITKWLWQFDNYPTKTVKVNNNIKT